ncbi:MAG: hypothetical protein LC777_14000 [Actinobacteria bacterium]|nr:hypothetical protein [Actinomycetota bacterium]
MATVSDTDLAVDGAHPATITALAVIERDGAPLIITAGGDGTLRSWRLDGSPGELAVDDAHPTRTPAGSPRWRSSSATARR